MYIYISKQADETGYIYIFRILVSYVYFVFLCIITPMS